MHKQTYICTSNLQVQLLLSFKSLPSETDFHLLSHIKEQDPFVHNQKKKYQYNYNSTTWKELENHLFQSSVVATVQI